MAELAHAVAENYLKHLYRLSLEEVPVKTSRLAQALKLSPATVTEMVKRLADQRLVTYVPYRGASLTPMGVKQALLVLRRHRLWEILLERVLGIPWDRVHAHAERLEHATDDELANYLDDYLGKPRFGPHGQPVPTADGTVEEVERLRLTGLPEGTVATIIQCADETPGLLDYLQSLGLVPGAMVRVGARGPLDGPLTVYLDGCPLAIGIGVADTLLVRVEPDPRA